MQTPLRGNRREDWAVSDVDVALDTLVVHGRTAPWDRYQTFRTFSNALGPSRNHLTQKAFYMIPLLFRNHAVPMGDTGMLWHTWHDLVNSRQGRYGHLGHTCHCQEGTFLAHQTTLLLRNFCPLQGVTTTSYSKTTVVSPIKLNTLYKYNSSLDLLTLDSTRPFDLRGNPKCMSLYNIETKEITRLHKENARGETVFLRSFSKEARAMRMWPRLRTWVWRLGSTAISWGLDLTAWQNSAILPPGQLATASRGDSFLYFLQGEGPRPCLHHTRPKGKLSSNDLWKFCVSTGKSKQSAQLMTDSSSFSSFLYQNQNSIKIFYLSKIIPNLCCFLGLSCNQVRGMQGPLGGSGLVLSISSCLQAGLDILATISMAGRYGNASVFWLQFRQGPREDQPYAKLAPRLTWLGTS